MTKKTEIARDLIALGSIPFCFIVIIRSLIGGSETFTYHLLLGLLVYYGLSKLVTTDHYIARSFILFIFISFFYKSFLFTLFAFLLWIAIIWAQHALKVKQKIILNGVVLGILSSVISYLVTLYIV